MKRRYYLYSLIPVAYLLWVSVEEHLLWYARRNAANYTGFPGLVAPLVLCGVVVCVLETRLWTATAALLGTTLVSTIGWLLIWMTPPAAQRAWCQQPEVWCEDGLMLLVLPLYGTMLGVVGLVVALAVVAIRGKLQRARSRAELA